MSEIQRLEGDFNAVLGRHFQTGDYVILGIWAQDNVPALFSIAKELERALFSIAKEVERKLEDEVFANDPEFIKSMEEADEDLEDGRTVSLDQEEKV